MDFVGGLLEYDDLVRCFEAQKLVSHARLQKEKTSTSRRNELNGYLKQVDRAYYQLHHLDRQKTGGHNRVT
jgi:hypothetical protein